VQRTGRVRELQVHRTNGTCNAPAGLNLWYNRAANVGGARRRTVAGRILAPNNLPWR